MAHWKPQAMLPRFPELRRRTPFFIEFAAHFHHV